MRPKKAGIDPIIYPFELQIILLSVERMDDAVVVTKEEEARFALFLRNLREKGRSPRTLRAYEFDWSQFAAWYAAVNQEPFTLERLAAMDVQDYLTWGQQQG